MISKDDFTGTKTMIKLILRRDRLILPLIIFFVAMMVYFVAATFINLYSDEALRIEFYLQMKNNPSVVSLLGALLDPSIGAITAWRVNFPVSFIIGLISIFLMVRYTRSEERKGRLELINSTKTGRLAVLSAAIITTFGLNLIIALLIFLGLASQNLDAYNSLLLGMSLAAFGCLFAAITGLVVQLTESSGDARYLMAGLLVVFFIIRIIGWDDGNNSWLSWFSPYGWVHHIGPFSQDKTWIFAVFLFFIAVSTAMAYYFSYIRDLGAGILPQRSGPARASKYLSSSLALAWRLHRGMLLFFIIIFVLMGIMLGYTAQTITEIVKTNPQFFNLILQLGGNAGFTDSYFTMILSLFSEVFAFYAILATLKLQSQELNRYSELILTSSVSRNRWATHNLIFAFLVPALVLIIFSLSMSLSYSYFTNNLNDLVLRFLEASLVYLPAIWLFTGISMFLFGLKPRLASLSWIILAAIVIINLLGEFFDINQWVLNISPFTHVPRLLAGDVLEPPIIMLLVVTLVLVLIGLLAYQRRDITD